MEDRYSQCFIPRRVQYFLKESMNPKWQSRARNYVLGSPSWEIQALLPSNMFLDAFYPRSPGQCHQLLSLPFPLACLHVLVRGWKLSSALSPGNPLGQQCGVYAGKRLVVSLWRVRPGSQPPAVFATTPAQSPRDGCPQRARPSKEALVSSLAPSPNVLSQCAGPGCPRADKLLSLG